VIQRSTTLPEDVTVVVIAYCPNLTVTTSASAPLDPSSSYVWWLRRRQRRPSALVFWSLELETHPVASKEDQGFFKSDGNLLNKGETYQDFLYK
jgi:hypothetical protein